MQECAQNAQSFMEPKNAEHWSISRKSYSGLFAFWVSWFHMIRRTDASAISRRWCLEWKNASKFDNSKSKKNHKRKKWKINVEDCWISVTAKLSPIFKESHFFVLGTRRGGCQRIADTSTVMRGRLYWADLMCSSTSLGVTQITCWPFQYFTMFIDCSVLMMSICEILVIWL